MEKAEAICRASPFGGAGLVDAIAAALAAVEAETLERAAALVAEQTFEVYGHGIVDFGVLADAIRSLKGPR